MDFLSFQGEVRNIIYGCLILWGDLRMMSTCRRVDGEMMGLVDEQVCYGMFVDHPAQQDVGHVYRLERRENGCKSCRCIGAFPAKTPDGCKTWSVSRLSVWTPGSGGRVALCALRDIRIRLCGSNVGIWQRGAAWPGMKKLFSGRRRAKC